MILWAALAIQAAAPQADAAVNRVVPFPAAEVARPTGDGEADPGVLHCTLDRHWCARVRPAEGPDEIAPWYLDVFEGAPADPQRAGRSHALPDTDDAALSIQPGAFATADGALIIRVQKDRRTTFSGGWAHASFVELVRAPGGEGAVEGLFTVPAGSGIGIRACFDDDDMRNRGGACHDEYAFDGTLMLDPAAGQGTPRFVLETRARSYPGRRSRSEDSTQAPPLRRSDLAWADDPGCSYRRTFARDPQTGRYTPDAPLPACADYLDF
jgi:hypothetical protein